MTDINTHSSGLSFSKEEMQDFARRYPWFDAAVRTSREGERLPAHILIAESVRPNAIHRKGITPVDHQSPQQKEENQEVLTESKPESKVSEEDSSKIKDSKRKKEKEKTSKKVSAKDKKAKDKTDKETSKERKKKSETSSGNTKADASGKSKTFGEEKPRKKPVETVSMIDIINEFIDSGEHKVVPTDDTPEYIAAVLTPDIPVDDELITEELAQIYLDQELFAQAKAIYERLSLLYPKKSVYFAEIIEKIPSSEE